MNGYEILGKAVANGIMNKLATYKKKRGVLCFE